MLTRLSPRRVVDLARQDLDGPVDVINLITTSRFDRYRWYALLVYPLMSAVGGRVLWMSRCDAVLAGDRQADKLLVVRYPSHRRFLAMILNPYYVAINLLREAGVERFEGSFTHATQTDPGLARRKALVGVHFDDAGALGALRDALAPGFELVYATSAVASLQLLDPPMPTDPNDLSHPCVALFAPLDPSSGGPDLAAIEEAAPGASVAAYVREHKSVYQPSLRPVAA